MKLFFSGWDLLDTALWLCLFSYLRIFFRFFLYNSVSYSFDNLQIRLFKNYFWKNSEWCLKNVAKIPRMILFLLFLVVLIGLVEQAKCSIEVLVPPNDQDG